MLDCRNHGTGACAGACVVAMEMLSCWKLGSFGKHVLAIAVGKAGRGIDQAVDHDAVIEDQRIRGNVGLAVLLGCEVALGCEGC